MPLDRHSESRYEPYWQRIRRLRTEAGLTLDELFRRAPGLSYETVRRIERDAAKPNSRHPSRMTLVAIAEALGVDPEQFPEYRLAVLRDNLDERVVGLERALETGDELWSAVEWIRQEVQE